jgi:CTP synthase
MSNHFGLEKRDVDLSKFEKIEKYLASDLQQVNIGVVGKYFHVPDAYKSLNEALFHAGIQNNVRVNITKFDSENYNDSDLLKMDGILVPGGFGNRGVDGKINAARIARENKIPYMGICLGMQIAVIEFMRNVMGVRDADSTEFSKTCTPVIDIMHDHDKADLGGTLRLGAYPCEIKSGSLAERVYGAGTISERHRHRYEMDINLEKSIAEHGMIISGKSPDGALPEMVELNNHPFFLAGQFHPEFQSSPYSGHPFFNAFIGASAKK